MNSTESPLEEPLSTWTPRRVILGTLVVLLVVIGFLLFYRFRLVVVIVFSGIVVSMAMAPGVDWLHRRRVRLVLLLSLPAAPFHDEAQALELLEPLTRDASSEYQALAQLLATLLNEQRRLNNQTLALQQKLERIKALEKELQQRAVSPESRTR